MIRKMLFAIAVLLTAGLASAQPNLNYSFARDNQGVPIIGRGLRPTVTAEMGIPPGTPFYDTSTFSLYYWDGSAWTGSTSTGQLLLTNGTGAAPSAAFASDVNTGIYRAAEDVTGFANGGYGIIGVRGSAGLGYGITVPNGSSIGFNGTTVDVVPDLFLWRDAANTLALRNGVNPQFFSVYNTYTDANNYERGRLKWNANVLEIGTTDEDAGGTGAARGTAIVSGATGVLKQGTTTIANWDTIGFYPGATDTYSSAYSTLLWTHGYFSRSIQGSKSKTLTEGAATSLIKIAVPQTAGSNFADATIQWVVYAADATDTQTLRGADYVSAVNKAGVETCTRGAVGTAINAVSAGTLTCTPTCVVGLTDEVEFALNCTSSLTQTTLKAQYRADMMQPNTYTPQ